MNKNVCRLLIILAVFSLVTCSKKAHDLSSQPTTLITPSLETNILDGRNLVYCSTLQIAWNILQDEIVKDKLLIEGSPIIVDMLNKQLGTSKDISESSYVAMGGEVTPDFLKNLNKALKEKFGDQAPPEISVPSGTAILLYAFLYKNVLFNKEFERLYTPLKFFSQGTQTFLRGFGINDPPYKDTSELRKQVTVFDYRDSDNFIIGLLSKSDSDDIILAKIIPDESLLKTFFKVNERIISSKASLLNENESLQIPAIELDKYHSFDELKGKHIKNEGKFRGYYISDAFQSVKFRLNEKGIFLKSEAIERIAAAPNPDIKRTFIFDKPFLIYIKEKNGKYPYFAMWVENPNILVSYESRKYFGGLIKAVADLIGAN